MIPTRIGQQLGGGTFTGFNRIGNRVYSIIVSPAQYEHTCFLCNTSSNASNAHSRIDGFANTAAMDSARHPAAAHCKSLIIDDTNDWYLPSRNELMMCYFYLKPTSSANHVFVTPPTYNAVYDTSRSSIPTGKDGMHSNPAQTIVTPFLAGSAESFHRNYYWASTQYYNFRTHGVVISFANGYLTERSKPSDVRVRAVRRILVVK